jgi:hypothetical protein
MIRPNGPVTRVPACGAERSKHKRQRVGCADSSAGWSWPPPSEFSTPGGSYCYQSNGGVVIPGVWYPIYNCLVINGDTINFVFLEQLISESPIGSQWCSRALWEPSDSLLGSVLTFTINPNPTGGWLPCAPGRTDVTNVKMKVSWSSPWSVISGIIYGYWANCTSSGGCSYWNDIQLVGLNVYPAPSPTTGPTGAPTSTGSPYPPTAPPLEIYDQRLEEIVSDAASPIPSADIGQSQSLLATASPGSGATVTDANWTLPSPFPVLYQTWASTSVSSVTPGAMPMATNPAQFYWIQGSSFYVVEVQAMVNSQNATAYALYSIEAPTFGMEAQFASPAVTSYPQPTPGSGLAWALELGNYETGGSQNGITSTYTATTSPHYGGWFAMNQVIKSNPIANPPSMYGGPYTGSAYWLDDCWINNVTVDGGGNSPPPSAGPNAPITYGPAYDSPLYGLYPPPGLLSLVVKDYFDDTFMYRPFGSNPPPTGKWAADSAIWVALGQLPWIWGGTASEVVSSPDPEYALSAPVNPPPYEYGFATSPPIGWPNLFTPRPGTPACPPTPHS